VRNLGAPSKICIRGKAEVGSEPNSARHAKMRRTSGRPLPGSLEVISLSGNLLCNHIRLGVDPSYNRDHSIALPGLTRSMSPILLRAGAALYARVIKGKGTHRAAHYVEGIQ
jgi:hypothetical protein